MITLKIKYSVDNDEQLTLIQKYQGQYSSLLHCMYQLLSKEDKLSSVLTYIKSDSICNNYYNSLNNIELMNYWFKQCSIRESYQMLQTGNRSCIFGGKKNFIRRCKGLISKEEYKKLKKLKPLYCIGDKSHKGNRFFYLQENINQILFKPNKQTHILLNIKLQCYKQILFKLYKLQETCNISITYKLDTEFIYISFEESELYNYKYNNYIQNRILCLDLNPNYIGYSIIDWKPEILFNVVKSGVYSIKELTDKEYSLKNKHYSSSCKEQLYINNKRRYETIQIVKNLVSKCIYYKCQFISIEDLNIKSQDNDRGKNYNRLVNNNWRRDLLVNNLQKRCNIFGIKLVKVKPEYSSFIGNFLYRQLNLPDMILSSIEIGRRGYEYYNQYISKQKEIKKNIIQPDIKLFNDLYTKSLEEFNIQQNNLNLIELYYLFKKSKIMYRLPLSQFNLKFSRFFSHTSYINVC